MTAVSSSTSQCRNTLIRESCVPVSLQCWGGMVCSPVVHSCSHWDQWKNSIVLRGSKTLPLGLGQKYMWICSPLSSSSSSPSLHAFKEVNRSWFSEMKLNHLWVKCLIFTTIKHCGFKSLLCNNKRGKKCTQMHYLPNHPRLECSFLFLNWIDNALICLVLFHFYLSVA